MARKKTIRLQASQFSLVDPTDGKERALLSIDAETGLPSLRFFDNEGIERVRLGIGKFGTGMTLLNEHGGVAYGVGYHQGESYGFELYHQHGGIAVSAKISTSGDLCLSLFDKDGNAIWKTS